MLVTKNKRSPSKTSFYVMMTSFLKITLSVEIKKYISIDSPCAAESKYSNSEEKLGTELSTESKELDYIFFW